MQLGPSGSPRPDVYTIPCSYTKFRPLAYEVKISVSDFRRDIVAGKWQSYLEFASAVIFAAPAGLIKKEDVPPGCGLIVRHDEVWRIAKGPTMKVTETLPRSAWLKLVIDGIKRQPEGPVPRHFNSWNTQDKIRKLYGEELASVLSSRDGAITRLRHQTESANNEINELAKTEQIRINRQRANFEAEMQKITMIKKEFCQLLGIPENSDTWLIQRTVHEAVARVSVDPEVKRLASHLSIIQATYTAALAPLPITRNDPCEPSA